MAQEAAASCSRRRTVSRLPLVKAGGCADHTVTRPQTVTRSTRTCRSTSARSTANASTASSCVGLPPASATEATDGRRPGQTEHAAALRDSPSRCFVRASPREASDDFRRLGSRVSIDGRPAERVDAEVLLEPLVDRHLRRDRSLLDPPHRGTRLRLGVGPRVGEASPRPPSPRACTRGPCRSAGAGSPRVPLTRTRSPPRSVERERREVGDDVGVEVASRVVHLVQQLLAHGVERDHAARLPRAS